MSMLELKGDIFPDEGNKTMMNISKCLMVKVKTSTSSYDLTIWVTEAFKAVKA